MTRTVLPEFLGPVVELPRPGRLKAMLFSFTESRNSNQIPGFAVRVQDRTEWCWAALTQGVLANNQGTQLSQCEIASIFLAKQCCGDSGAENRPQKLSEVLTKFALLDGQPIYGPVPEARVIDEIDRGRPVCILLDFTTRAHVVGICGYKRGFDGALRLLIMDSRSGAPAIETAANPFKYDGAYWGWTYLTSRTGS